MTGESTATVIRASVYKPPAAPLETRTWLERHRVQLALTVLTAFVGLIVWFLFTSVSVRLEFVPENATVTISGGFDVEFAGTWILREGNYTVEAQAVGYEPLEAPLTVGSDANQTQRYALVPLPGKIDFVTVPPGAEVLVDGDALGVTPLAAMRVSAGAHVVALRHPRYQVHEQPLAVEGHEVSQLVEVALLPNWATITLDSSPSGATVYVDDIEAGSTPGQMEILAGYREIRLKRTGFKSWRNRLEVTARIDAALPLAVLEPADALLELTSNPAGASVTVDGAYQGLTPLEIGVAPGRDHRVRVSKAGFAAATRVVKLGAAEERDLAIDLTALTGEVVFAYQPADAQILIDGRLQAPGTRRLALAARSHRVAVRKSGYQDFEAKVTPQPGMTQELRVNLLTVAEARLASLQPRRKNPVDGEMVLLDGGAFQMGASRREPGRRANEVLREIDVTRLFYLGTDEITNAQFRRFATGHTSGKFEDQELDKEDQPVVGVSWEEAALFCNWLSEKGDLPAFYRVEYGKVIGFDPKSTGFRLPTEAEWEWATRTAPDRQQVQRFPWGEDLPPSDRYGNFADRSAAHLVGRVIFGYSDNYIVSAPVGSFAADPRGVHDLAGNVAEWVNDYYEIPIAQAAKDPMGPTSGDYHAIRGSSWMHGTITDLRGAFRDYGVDERVDLGFRVARFAEAL